MSELELAQAADWFALGCVIAELYTLTPLFSQRSIVEYLDSYADAMESGGAGPSSNASDEWTSLLSSLAQSSEPFSVHWNHRVAERLKALPMNLKVRKLRNEFDLMGFLNRLNVCPYLIERCVGFDPPGST